MNNGQYVLPAFDCLELSFDNIFQPDAQPLIRSWLTDGSKTREQKESFLQRLLDFDDHCGNFYQYRAFLLAANYLALCPDCRQGDAIVDRLLKFSYSYFRVERAEWCIQPEAFVRAAREHLVRTDLGRVIDRFEALIRQTESRAIMSHAAHQLLKMQPGNRCAVAAIVFNEIIPDPKAKQFDPQDPYIHLQWITALRSLVEEPIRSNEVAEAISQVLTCGYSDRLRYHAVKNLIQYEPAHPLIFPYLWNLTVEEKNRYVYIEDEDWGFPELIDNLWHLLYSLDATCLTKLMEKIERWNENCEEDSWLATQILGKLGKGCEAISDLLICFLQKIYNSTIPESSYNDVIDALGNVGFSTSDTTDLLTKLFQEIESPETQYKIAIALAKLDHHVEAIVWIQEALSQVADSEFTLLLEYPLHDRLGCNLYKQALCCEDTKEFALEVMKQVLQANWHWRNRHLLYEIDAGKPIVIQAIRQKLEDRSNPFKVYNERDVSFLQEIKHENPWLISSIEHLLETELDSFYTYEFAQILLKLEPNNSVALKILNILLMRNCDQDISVYFGKNIGSIICLLILNCQNENQSLQKWLRYLDAPTIFELERITNALHQSNLGSFQTFQWILNHLNFAIQKDICVNAEERYSRYSSENQWIIPWLQVFSEEDLRQK